MKWKSSSPADWKTAIEEYDRKLESGELRFDGKGDIIPHLSGPSDWCEFLAARLPPYCFGRRSE